MPASPPSSPERRGTTAPSPPVSPNESTLHDGGRVGETERDRIVRVLAECIGNQTRAAKRLGIARSTLIEKIELYQIPRPRKTPGS